MLLALYTIGFSSDNVISPLATNGINLTFSCTSDYLYVGSKNLYDIFTILGNKLMGLLLKKSYIYTITLELF